MSAPGLVDPFARRDLLVLSLALCGLAGLYLTDDRQQLAYRAINIVSWALLTWMVVRVVFSLFRDWANRPSPTFAYLSYASYSIYLFHHVVVIATATALLPLPLGGGGQVPDRAGDRLDSAAGDPPLPDPPLRRAGLPVQWSHRAPAGCHPCHAAWRARAARDAEKRARRVADRQRSRASRANRQDLRVPRGVTIPL